MKQRVFSDQRDTLIKMYNMMKAGKTRKQITIDLQLSLDFYDRFKNQYEIFSEYCKSQSAGARDTQ
jgi:hypothetical protein